MLSSLYRMVHGMISREGTNATLTQLGTEGAYDPATAEYSPSTSTITTVKVVLLDYSTAQTGLRVNENTIIELGDKQCYMDARVNNVGLAKKPSPAGDTITVNGVVWRIMNVKEYNPNDTVALMYDITLRK